MNAPRCPSIAGTNPVTLAGSPLSARNGLIGSADIKPPTLSALQWRLSRNGKAVDVLGLVIFWLYDAICRLAFS